AKLEAAEVERPAMRERRKVTSQDVVKRFDAVWAAFQQPQAATDVSMGAILAIEALGRILRREAEAIEYFLSDTLSQPIRRILVTPETITNATRVREARRPY